MKARKTAAADKYHGHSVLNESESCILALKNALVK